MQIQYQINTTTEENWKTISNGGTVGNLNHGDTVFARLYDGRNHGDYASVNILDGTAPTVQISVGETTYNSIAVRVTANDGQSGLATSNTYKYYLNNSLKKTTTETSYKFEGLTAETSYEIKVEAYDKANNKGTDTESVSTIKFEPKPTPDPDDGGKPMSDMSNGLIEIEWLNGTSNEVTDKPNNPKVKTGLPSGTTMQLVKFNNSSKKWELGTEYNYIAGTGSKDNTSSKWANAKVTIDGVDSYFVWIPRYAYRIIYFNNVTSKQEYQEGKITEEEAVEQGKIIGYSDSRGIVDAQGKKINGVYSTTKVMVNGKYFMTHPAFMNGTSTGFENGEWNRELEGIWIGKYETSRSDSTSSTEGTKSTLKVQPGVISLRDQDTTVGNLYSRAMKYMPDAESHMLKNSEWGAAVYLTESKYGRNGTEVGFNSQEYLTGGGSDNAYTTNTNQSSTGNIYGIYDLRGGATEYIAGYYIDGDSRVIGNGASLTSGETSSETIMVYNGINVKEDYKYGDATYETMGWHSDTCVLADEDYPFIVRGGYYRER